jgi:hypothetical protein
MSDIKIQNVEVKISRLDPGAPGFLPRYRQLLSARRALGDFDKAQPEDVDQVYALLTEHVIEPANPAQKRKVLDMLSVEDLMKIFDEVMGKNTVNPPSGGD